MRSSARTFCLAQRRSQNPLLLGPVAGHFRNLRVVSEKQTASGLGTAVIQWSTLLSEFWTSIVAVTSHVIAAISSLVCFRLFFLG